MDNAVKDYARRIAEAAYGMTADTSSPPSTAVIDAIIASVPAPDVQGADKLAGNSDVQAQDEGTYRVAYLAGLAEIGRLEELAEVQMQMAIDAARAEEREAIIQWITAVHPWLRRLMDEISRGYHNMTDEARARSGALSEQCRCDGDLDEHESGCVLAARSGARGV